VEGGGWFTLYWVAMRAFSLLVRTAYSAWLFLTVAACVVDHVILLSLLSKLVSYC
jgi:hypothetical protein